MHILNLGSHQVEEAINVCPAHSMEVEALTRLAQHVLGVGRISVVGLCNCGEGGVAAEVVEDEEDGEVVEENLCSVLLEVGGSSPQFLESQSK